MSKHYNIILASALVKNGNRGCVALSYSSMLIISELLEKNNVGYTFYLCDSGFKDRKEHSIEVNGKTLTFFDLGKPWAYSLKDKIKNIIRYYKIRKDLAIYKKADFMLDIGQGDSFADIYGEKRFNLIFKSYELAHKYDIPFCLLPQTIGPFNDSKIRKRAALGINKVACVLARDKQSLEYTKTLLPQKPIEEIIDVAFFMPYTEKQFSKNFIHVGLNISALLWNGGYTKDNQFGLKDDYQKVIRNIIDYFLSIPNVQVHLIPHVVNAERNIENDYAVSYNLCEEYNDERLILAPLFLDPIIAKSYIAGMDFFMGARMHSTIAAFSSGVPVVPMAYSRKFNGLFEDTLQYNHMVDLKTMDCDEITSLIKKSFENRTTLKEEIVHQQNTTIKERKDLLETELLKFFQLN